MKVNLFFCIFFSILSLNIFAQNTEVAKVIKMSGRVEAQFTKGKTIELEVDQLIPEGAKIKTSSNSFVRMIFNDKSEISLGPNSLMTINSFQKDEKVIISLLRGQVRSQVTKDYRDIAETANSKLYIKTKTAALGVRGTDFQVNYNSKNQNTSLITFEGQVAMAYIEEADRHSNLRQEHMLRILNTNKTVLVDRGHISAINLNIAPRPMVPTVLDANQINILAKQNIDPTKLPDIAKRPVVATEPNGFFHEETGEYKLPAGSIVDLKTVNIVPPPKDALLNPKTNTFMVPTSHGKIDPKTGAYKPPMGLKLESNGKFTPTDHRPNSFKQDLPKLYDMKQERSEVNKLKQISPNGKHSQLISDTNPASNQPQKKTPKEVLGNMNPRPNRDPIGNPRDLINRMRHKNQGPNQLPQQLPKPATSPLPPK